MSPGEAQIVMRIDPKEKDRLELEAKKQGLSLSAYIRRILFGLQGRPKR